MAETETQAMLHYQRLKYSWIIEVNMVYKNNNKIDLVLQRSVILCDPV